MKARKCSNLGYGGVLAAALSVLTGCGTGNEAEVIRTVGVDVSVREARGALLAEGIHYAFGTYGTGCEGRQDGSPWYVVFDDGADAPSDRGEPLSILMDPDVASCTLALTGIHADVDGADVDLMAVTALPITFDAPFVPGNARAFETTGGDVVFYANAQLREDAAAETPTAVLTFAFAPDPDVADAMPVPAPAPG